MTRPALPMRALALALVLLLASPARADVLGLDLGPLATLVGQASVQITHLAETLRTVRQTYDETKRYVGMVGDTVAGFNSAVAWGRAVIENPISALDGLNPDLAYLRRDVASPAGWAQGTGELQRRIRLCLAGNTGCAEVYGAVRASEARAAIRSTYGLAPPGRDDIEVADVEAAAALSDATVHAARAAVTDTQAEAFRRQCLAGTGPAAMEACRTAAELAQILALREAASSNQQLGVANRLAATALARDAARDKRAAVKEALEAHQRDELIRAGARSLVPPDVTIKTH